MSNEKPLENEENQASIDPWAAAFAALDKKPQEDSQDDSNTGTDVSNESNTTGVNQGQGSSAAQETNIDTPEISDGGTGDLGGANNGTDDIDSGDDFLVTQEEIEAYKIDLNARIERQTLEDVAQAYIKQGARHVNGRLGATINDADICKRDSDGVPRFYNPETGREFTGDNPRRQAQEWVDDYNRELADAYNRTCEGYYQKLMQEQGASLAVMEFAPKYDQLDDIRKSMFDSIIEDYEITDDNGNVIGYSCDLDRALSAVNRQVQVIQQRYQQTHPEPELPKPTGPALDLPSSAATNQDNRRPEFKSIEEAMEWQQDQLLAKMKGNK